MTYLETQLVDRCNRLTMMLFLQEMRAQVMARQISEANAVIETAAETLQKMTEVLCGAVDAREIGRMC